ncbi:uncharacterized protein LOC132197270 [Neocloeon triangulifer]|uniref:uncharacterized protein LOC132197270 n=1 Tax=Neocloeon triangulifer TaxID=2078957 RepID=UPI00286F3E66|nr:uncharacterized protein LOC132197270 [Neocloeon triangulifer]
MPNRFVTLAAIVLPTAAAFWFDPSTGKCEGQFQPCPSQPAERVICRFGSFLQCYDSSYEEVILPCTENHDNSTTHELPRGLPCKNETLSSTLTASVTTQMTSIITNSTKTTKIPTKTTTISKYNVTEDILDSKDFFAEGESPSGLSFDKFVHSARPTLIVIASLAGIILTLTILICIVSYTSCVRKQFDDYTPC